MEIDVLLNRFRNASRELFNNYFHASTHDESAWVAEERFSILEEELFKMLVMYPAGLSEIDYGEVQSEILVRPRNGSSIPWLLSQEVDANSLGHSRVLVTDVTNVTEDAILHFEQYFDWDQVGYKDNHYVRVFVAGWTSHPELVGAYGLVEAQFVRFERA